MPKCNKCHDSTFIQRFNETIQENEWVPCECRLKNDAEALLDSRLTEANIRKTLRGYTIDDYKKLGFRPDIKEYNKASLERFEGFLNDPNTFLDKYKSLWLWGADANAGHTTLAVIFGTELIKHGKHVRFIKIQDLLNAFVAFETKHDYFTDLQRFDVYIIDDIFVDMRMVVPKAYSGVQLFQFIDEALNNDKWFIFTSDKHYKVIPQQYIEIQTILVRSILALEFRGTIALGD